MLQNMQGISYAEVLAQKDGDANMYMIESEFGVDIRKKLFFSLAERGWAMIGLEALGMSLEDIFITVVDKSEEKKITRTPGRERGARRRAKESGTLEQEIGTSVYEDALRQRSEAAQTVSEDED